MAVTQSFPTQHPDGLPLTDTRRVFGGMVVRDQAGNPRAGLLSAGTDLVVTGRASMGYNVAPFVAVTSRTVGGVEFVANDATIIIPTAAAPSANRRIDVIWVRSRFALNGDSANIPEIGVTQGNASASPAKPSIPAGAVELAAAEVLSTSTTTASVVITQTAPWSAMAGGVIPFRNGTELAAWVGANGSQAMRLDTGARFVAAGGSWVGIRDVLLASPQAVLVGPIPPPGTPLIRQQAVVQASSTTNSNGDGSLNYPTPFPNGVISATITRYDFNGIGPSVQILNSIQSLSALNFRIYGLNGGLASGIRPTFTVNAIGW